MMCSCVVGKFFIHVVLLLLGGVPVVADRVVLRCGLEGRCIYCFMVLYFFYCWRFVSIFIDAFVGMMVCIIELLCC